MSLVSFGRRLTSLAESSPTTNAVIFVSQSGIHQHISWQTLERVSNQLARLFADEGCGPGAVIALGLSNSPEHVAACYAAWKLGATVLPLSPISPEREREKIIGLARPALIIADWDASYLKTLCTSDLDRGVEFPDCPLPDQYANPGRIFASSGTTGTPKLILNPGDWAGVPGASSNFFQSLGINPGETSLIAGPMHHTGPFMSCHTSIFEGHTTVLMERFDAELLVEIVPMYEVSTMSLVPTMMQRILALESPIEDQLRSIQCLVHTGAKCPAWVKRRWIDLIGADRVLELYSMTETIGMTYIRGDEWLLRPGSVGKPLFCEVAILDHDGKPCPPGEIGELFMKMKGARKQTFTYLGTERARHGPDGFASVGDLGWLDDDNYLYLVDRRDDLIITGGVNVYPAEVEGVFQEHPEVVDVAVIGIEDAEWGTRVHAVIQPRNATDPPRPDELDRFCRCHLAPQKVPKTYDFVTSIPRTESGKLKRSQLSSSHATPNGNHLAHEELALGMSPRASRLW